MAEIGSIFPHRPGDVVRHDEDGQDYVVQSIAILGTGVAAAVFAYRIMDGAARKIHIRSDEASPISMIWENTGNLPPGDVEDHFRRMMRKVTFSNDDLLQQLLLPEHRHIKDLLFLAAESAQSSNATKMDEGLVRLASLMVDVPQALPSQEEIYRVLALTAQDTNFSPHFVEQLSREIYTRAKTVASRAGLTGSIGEENLSDFYATMLFDGGAVDPQNAPIRKLMAMNFDFMAPPVEGLQNDAVEAWFMETFGGSSAATFPGERPTSFLSVDGLFARQGSPFARHSTAGVLDLAPQLGVEPQPGALRLASFLIGESGRTTPRDVRRILEIATEANRTGEMGSHIRRFLHTLRVQPGGFLPDGGTAWDYVKKAYALATFDEDSPHEWLTQAQTRRHTSRPRVYNLRTSPLPSVKQVLSAYPRKVKDAGTSRRVRTAPGIPKGYDRILAVPRAQFVDELLVGTPIAFEGGAVYGSLRSSELVRRRLEQMLPPPDSRIPMLVTAETFQRMRETAQRALRDPSVSIDVAPILEESRLLSTLFSDKTLVELGREMTSDERTGSLAVGRTRYIDVPKSTVTKIRNGTLPPRRIPLTPLQQWENPSAPTAQETVRFARRIGGTVRLYESLQQAMDAVDSTGRTARRSDIAIMRLTEDQMARVVSDQQALNQLFEKVRVQGYYSQVSSRDFGDVSSFEAHYLSSRARMRVALLSFKGSEDLRIVGTDVDRPLHEQLRDLRGMLSRMGTDTDGRPLLGAGDFGLDLESSYPTKSSPGWIRQIGFKGTLADGTPLVFNTDSMLGEGMTHLVRGGTDSSGEVTAILRLAKLLSRTDESGQEMVKTVATQTAHDFNILIDRSWELINSGSEAANELREAIGVFSKVRSQKLVDAMLVSQVAGATSLGDSSQEAISMRILGRQQTHEGLQDVEDMLEIMHKLRQDFEGGYQGLRSTHTVVQTGSRAVGISDELAKRAFVVTDQRNVHYGQAFMIDDIRSSVRLSRSGVALDVTMLEDPDIPTSSLQAGLTKKTLHFSNVFAMGATLNRAEQFDVTASFQEALQRASQLADEHSQRYIRATNPMGRTYWDPFGMFDPRQAKSTFAAHQYAVRSAVVEDLPQKALENLLESGGLGPEHAKTQKITMWEAYRQFMGRHREIDRTRLNSEEIRRATEQFMAEATGVEFENATAFQKAVAKQLEQMMLDPVERRMVIPDYALRGEAPPPLQPDSPTNFFEFSRSEVGRYLRRLADFDIMDETQNPVSGTRFMIGHQVLMRRLAKDSEVFERITTQNKISRLTLSAGDVPIGEGVNVPLSDTDLVLRPGQAANQLAAKMLLHRARVDPSDDPVVRLLAESGLNPGKVADEMLVMTRASGMPSDLYNYKNFLDEFSRDIANKALGSPNYDRFVAYHEYLLSSNRFKDLIAENLEESMTEVPGEAQDFARQIVSAYRSASRSYLPDTDRLMNAEEALNYAFTQILDGGSEEERHAKRLLLQEGFSKTRESYDIGRANLSREYIASVESELKDVLGRRSHRLGHVDPYTMEIRARIGYERAKAVRKVLNEQKDRTGREILEQTSDAFMSAMTDLDFTVEELHKTGLAYNRSAASSARENMRFMHTARAASDPARHSSRVAENINSALHEENLVMTIPEALNATRFAAAAGIGILAAMAAYGLGTYDFSQGHVSDEVGSHIAKYSEMPGTPDGPQAQFGAERPFAIDMTFHGMVADRRHQEEIVQQVFDSMSGSMVFSRVNNDIQDRRRKSAARTSRDMIDRTLRIA